MSANLTNEINDTDKMSEYISEARHMGIEILPPDINLSEKYFTVSEGKIVYGLIGIKNVGTAAVDEIVRERNENGLYSTFEDFLDRNDLRVINKKVLETLIKSGLFDKIASGRAILYNNLDRLVEAASREQENRKYGQSSLFESSDAKDFPAVELEAVPEWPEKELLAFEKENLGFYFSGHPLKKYKNIYEKCVTLRLNELDRSTGEKKYIVLGIVKGIRQFTTKSMQQMASVTIETFEGEIQIVMFPSVWGNFRYLVIEEKTLGFTVKVDKNSFEPKLICEKVSEPEELSEASFREIHFEIDGDFTQENLDILKSFLLENNGSCQVFFHIHDGPSKEIIVKAAPQVNTVSDENFIAKAQEYPFIKSVWRE